MGRVSFVRVGDTITVQVALMGLAPGPHGIHVHENGDCSAPDASSAGEHFNPSGQPHGGLDAPPTQRHPGDLGNITAKDTGEVEETLTSDTLLADGEFAMLGKSLVVHEGVDDERTQPSGDSGDPAACGVIVAAPPAPSVHLG
jgi:Cu-Zn family superoxide dismutase